MDLGWERWAGLDDSAAQALAGRIAAAVGAGSVEVRPHAYAGGDSRTALFDVDGMRFALVPAREVEVGYDSGRFSPTPEQLAGYRESVKEFGLAEDIHAYAEFVQQEGANLDQMLVRPAIPLTG